MASNPASPPSPTRRWIRRLLLAFVGLVTLGAAHLPGMVAAVTTLPVIGVPIKSSNSIDGWDSVLSILQMPNGVPVGTVALNAAKNAGILAAEILGTADETVSVKIAAYKNTMNNEVIEKAEKMKREGWENKFD